MMVIQRLLTPGSRDATVRFFKLAAVCGVILLVIQYYLRSTDGHDRALRPSLAAQRRREHISHVTTLYNYSVDRIWPRSDVDDDDDRVLSQIDAMNVYAQQKHNRTLKTILIVGNFNINNWKAGQEQFVHHGCPIVDCWLTNNQSLAGDADALLITEFYDSSRHLYLPKPRRQIWIVQHRESPLRDHIDPYSVRGLINWTASYRRDSTVVFPYGKMVRRNEATAAVTSREGSFNYAGGKTKLVAWFVSNCNARNQRMRYARELSQFIQV